MKTSKKIRAVLSIIGANLFGIRTPLCVDLIVTYRCNSKCRYCTNHLKNVPEMSTKEIFRLVDSADKAGCAHIDICGGEPLLRKDIGRIIDYIHNKGIFVSMATNGYLLPQMIDTVKNVDLVTISLDGPEEVHEKNRGKGTHEKVMKAIDTALAHKMNLMTITVLSDKNINELGYIINLSKKKGFKCFFEPLYHNPLFSQNSKDVVPDRKKYRKEIRMLIQERAHNDLITGSSRYFEYLYDGKLPFRRCFAGELYCRVEPNGIVYPCMDSIGVLKGAQSNNRQFKEIFRKIPRLDYTNCKTCICPLNCEYNHHFSINSETVKKTVSVFRR